jgi:hypothetical protein
MKCRYCGGAIRTREAALDSTTVEPACRGACSDVSLASGLDAYVGVQRLARLLFDFGLAASAPSLFATKVEPL